MSTPYARTSPPVAAPRPGRGGFALPRRVRRLLVILHIAVSVGWLANNLVIAPTVAVTLYMAIVAISVLKPWGRIRR